MQPNFQIEYDLESLFRAEAVVRLQLVHLFVHSLANKFHLRKKDVTSGLSNTSTLIYLL